MAAPDDAPPPSSSSPAPPSSTSSTTRRRFLPQPYETSSTRSAPRREKHVEFAAPPPQSEAAPHNRTPAVVIMDIDHNADQPRKRFRPEPVETSSRSNRAAPAPSDDGSNISNASSMSSSDSSAAYKTPSRRKFAVEHVETSKRSHRPSSPEANVTIEAGKPARRRFKIEVLETGSRTRKAGDPAPGEVLARQRSKSPSSNGGSPSPDGYLTPRPGVGRAISNPIIPVATFLKPAPNRQGSMHPHYNTRAPSRAHSFRVPDLERIDSSESDRSESPNMLDKTRSHPEKPHMRESVDDRFSGYLLALAARAAEKQLREQEAALFPSTDSHEPISHYGVDESDSSEGDNSIPRVAAPKPKPVVHKYRKDTDEDNVALAELRKHGEKIQQTNENTRPPVSLRGQRKKTGAFNVEFDVEAKQDAWLETAPPRDVIGGYQKDPDLKQMRKAASPPMLGGDMSFPRCPSPEHARFDVTQGAEYLRNNISYCSIGQAPGIDERLWNARDGPVASNKLFSTSSKEIKPKPMGLWGGHCNTQDAKMFATPVGLVTPVASPSLEREDPFSSLSPAASSPSQSHTTASTASTIAAPRPVRPPPSPPPSTSSRTATTPHDPASEQRLAAEFPDSFVTQVYNYLSLGFPALARKFDPELSKISGVPIAELRRDDRLAEARGYVRFGADEVGIEVPRSGSLCDDDNKAAVDVVREGGAAAGDIPAIPEQQLASTVTSSVPATPGAGAAPAATDAETAATLAALDKLEDISEDVEVRETMCRRWLALRLYVREWGRQMGVADAAASNVGGAPKLDPHRAWGIPARKGSWAN